MIKLACMTLPYAALPFERALQGISEAGFRYISFGISHAKIEVPDETDAQAVAKLEKQFAKYGVQPIQLVSTPQLAAGQPIERVRARLTVAKELGIPEVLSLGTWNYSKFPDEMRSDEEMEPINQAFADQFKRVAEEAEKLGVIVTIKPHGGNTATASHIQETLQRIGSSSIRASYDPGNVQYYEGVVSHLDFPTIAAQTVSVIAKDHRGERAQVDFPVPGTGDVDFVSIFQTWKQSGAAENGHVVVERIDGSSEAEQVDQRIAASYPALKQLLRDAGLDSE